MITSVKIKDNTKTPFEYVSDIEAFENGREFIFKPGVNVIIGKNGSGKSTLLNIISMYALCDKSMCSEMPDEALDFPPIFDDDDKVLDGIDISSDYIGKVFRLLPSTETNRDSVLKNISNFDLYANSIQKSYGEKVVLSTVFDLSRDEIVALTDEDISLYIDKELANKGIPIEAKNWNIKNKKEVVYPRTGVPVFMLKDIGIGFRTIEGATEVANLLVKYNAFKTESRYLAGSYEQFWIMKEGVCPAVKGETGYSKEEFDKIDEKNKNPELTSINTFNDTVKKANEIKDRVLKCVYNIKQECSYNNDLVGIFERYKDIADGDMEVAMNFIKEAYPFNEETESFIRKKFDMPIPDESKEQ